MDEPIGWEDVYPLMDEVKAMARGLLSREHSVGSLQTTALVLTALRRQRLADQDWDQVTWSNRHYFYGAMYQAMQRALLDHARKRNAQKRAGETLMSPDELQLLDLKHTLEQEPSRVVALVETLAWLKEENSKWAELIEHRYYGGLTLDETARVMGVSLSTVQRWWRQSRIVLHQKITAYLTQEMA